MPSHKLPLKAAVEDASYSDNMHQSLIENIGVGVVKQDSSGQIVFVNSAALDMLGLTKEQMMGKTSVDPSWNVIHEDGSDFPGNTHPTYIAMTTFQPVHDVVMGVYRPMTKDRVWILVNAEPQFKQDGAFDFVFCTFTDITGYKQAQDELTVKNKILQSIEEFSPDILSIINELGNHIYVNKSATTISGYSNQELLQINATDLVPEKDKQLLQAALQTVRAEGELKNVMGKLVCKDGSIKYISWNLHWDAASELIYVNGRDKTAKVAEDKETELIRVALDLYNREIIFDQQEHKRNTIGYELHENVGQVLATLKLYLDQ